jgi:dihydroorotate dehydrogenase
MANLARRLVELGADGLVLFNRFYQPDLDIEALEVTPGLELSTPAELRLRLRWVAILHGHLGRASLASAASSHTAADVVKALLAGADAAMLASALLAGADAAMLASALLRGGPEHLARVEADLRHWRTATATRRRRPPAGSASGPSATRRRGSVPTTPGCWPGTPGTARGADRSGAGGWRCGGPG